MISTFHTAWAATADSLHFSYGRLEKLWICGLVKNTAAFFFSHQALVTLVANFEQQNTAQPVTRFRNGTVFELSVSAVREPIDKSWHRVSYAFCKVC